MINVEEWEKCICGEELGMHIDGSEQCAACDCKEFQAVITEEEYNEAMGEMVCWQMGEHIKKCGKCSQKFADRLRKQLTETKK